MTDYIYRALVTNVYDADSIHLLVILEEVTVDYGFYVEEHRKKVHPIKTRLVGWDAPELGKPGGVEARDWLRERMPIGEEVVLQTFKTPGDKYGRWLAIIEAPDIGDVGSALYQAGFAAPYDGGAR